MIPLTPEGNTLLRALNQAVQETIEKWVADQGNFEIKHDGALVTVSERPDILQGYIVKVEWPFWYKDKE